MSGELRPCSRCNGSGAEPAGDMVGMCGARSPEMTYSPSVLCELPAGHLGWHRGPNVLSEDGHVIPPVQWGIAADLPVVAASVLGSGEQPGNPARGVSGD